jgi:hypothetical protein
MAASKATKRSAIRFDEFVEVATDSALRVIAERQRVGGLKYNPKIWVGIWIDPIPGGPGGPGGPVGPLGPGR